MNMTVTKYGTPMQKGFKTEVLKPFKASPAQSWRLGSYEGLVAAATTAAAATTVAAATAGTTTAAAAVAAAT